MTQAPADIHDATLADAEAPVPLRVNLPAKYRLKLSALKIAGRGSISSNVQQALDDYFLKIQKETKPDGA